MHLDLRSTASWLFHAAEQAALESLKARVDAKLKDILATGQPIPEVEPFERPEVTGGLNVRSVHDWVDSISVPTDGDKPGMREFKARNIFTLLQLAATLKKILDAIAPVVPAPVAVPVVETPSAAPEGEAAATPAAPETLETPAAEAPPALPAADPPAAA